MKRLGIILLAVTFICYWEDARCIRFSGVVSTSARPSTTSTTARPTTTTTKPFTDAIPHGGDGIGAHASNGEVIPGEHPYGEDGIGAHPSNGEVTPGEHPYGEDGIGAHPSNGEVIPGEHPYGEDGIGAHPSSGQAINGRLPNGGVDDEDVREYIDSDIPGEHPYGEDGIGQAINGELPNGGIDDEDVTHRWTIARTQDDHDLAGYRELNTRRVSGGSNDRPTAVPQRAADPQVLTDTALGYELIGIITAGVLAVIVIIIITIVVIFRRQKKNEEDCLADEVD